MDITSINKLLLAIAFFIPGFVAMKLYGILSSGERLDASKSMVDAVSFSCMNYAVWSWLIILVFRYEWIKFYPGWFLMFVIFVLFFAPAGSSVFFFYLRKKGFFVKWLPHPVGKPWDFVFSRRESCYVIIFLKGGRRIGGYYGPESFVSSYPYEEQIFIEKVWRVDEEEGFIEEHTRTKGMMISGANIETIEFIGYS